MSRLFSPRIVTKALASLDKSTALVVSACWLAALVMLILATFAVHGAVSARKEAAEAMVAEPALPQEVDSPINVRDARAIMDRLQHQFPEIKINLEANEIFTIKSEDGAKFHQWIMAVSYIDTMAPEYRWSLREFCVGACGSQGLMKAVIVGQKMIFSAPQH
ncbi:MAG: hypothetical protein P4M13_06615 [Alphaproteobacteria bacterium]|nr:hypothetical protein [Alphaproteobacteria bacterium]